MVFHTFDEWKELGFYVNFGEKSFKRNELGECIFSENQVSEKDVENIEGCDIVFNDLISDFEYPHY